MFLSQGGMRKAVVWVLSVVVPVMTAYAAENHVVPLTELHRQMVSASEARQTRLAGVRTVGEPATLGELGDVGERPGEPLVAAP